MFIFFSKFLPVFLYPLGLACLLVGTAVFLFRRPRLQRTLLLLALGLLWFSSTKPVSYALLRSLEQQYLPPAEWPSAEAIVILGGGAAPSFPPRQLAEVNEAGDRMVLGAWLYHQGKADKVLLTGGAVPWVSPEQRIPEAAYLSPLMQMLGVPEEALLWETESRNTYENALYSRQVLSEQGINRILLVTSASHMPRSVRLYEAQGFAVIPAPTDFAAPDAEWEHLFTPSLAVQLLNWVPDARHLHQTQVALKEYVGLLVYRLQGWL
jgi:uncharacterized SAM-binding protein YcdF (DUF218 family)